MSANAFVNTALRIALYVLNFAEISAEQTETRARIEARYNLVLKAIKELDAELTKVQHNGFFMDQSTISNHRWKAEEAYLENDELRLKRLLTKVNEDLERQRFFRRPVYRNE